MRLYRAGKNACFYLLMAGLLVAGWLLTACTSVPPAPQQTGTPGPRITPASLLITRTARGTARPATATPAPTSAVDVDASRLEGVQVAFWHPWVGETAGALQSLADEFNSMNEWGIRVRLESKGSLDDLAAQIDAAESGDLPTLAAAYHYTARAWAEDGKLADLAPYASDPQWGLAGNQVDFYPAFWEQDLAGEKRLGLPLLRTAQVLVYNQSWAEELGFRTPPATPEQLRQQACAAAAAYKNDDERLNDGRGGWIVSTGYSSVLSWMYSFGGGAVSDNGGGYRFNTEEVEDAFTFLRRLYDAGCAWQQEGLPAESDFAGRQGLLSVTSLTGLPAQAAAFERAGSKDRWTVIAYPSPGQKPGLSVYGPSAILFRGSPEEQLAGWLFLRWLVSPENHAPFAAATGSFPLSPAELDRLADYRESHPHWAAAIELLPGALSEPPFASWATVRWAVSDAATQLFRYYFTAEQTSDLVELLQRTAADLHTSR